MIDKICTTSLLARIFPALVVMSLLPQGVSAAPTTLAAPQPVASREVSGWVERVRISPGDIMVHGKLDTGADISSLNATDLEQFDKEGQKWVRFKVLSRTGRSMNLERPIKRFALIKRHTGKHDKRVVVRLGICIGTHFMEADVNLVDRANFEHQMLVGRNFMAGHLIIDPAITFSLDPRCTEEQVQE